MFRRYSAAAGASVVTAGCLVVAAGCDIRDEAPRPLRPQALLGVVSQANAEASGRAIEYVRGLDAGRQRAVAEDRPLFLVCTAGWCRFSAEMTQRTLRDPRVVATSRRAVCVLLDADHDADTCRGLGVRAFPSLLVLGTDGREHFRSTGRSSPDAVVAGLEQALGAQRIAGAPADQPIR